jgi:hypothetical protein
MRIYPLLRVFALGLVFAVPAKAAPPDDDAARRGLIGPCIRLDAQPATVILDGPRAMQQVLISGHYADGSTRDLTHLCTWTLNGPDVVGVGEGLFLRPRCNGKAQLRISVGQRELMLPVEVAAFEQPHPVSFQHEMIAALTVAGCNQGACHGTPSGKNGFRLSLRGYDPQADYLQLTHDVSGRRTDRLEPSDSLILQKALGRVPHEGGMRFAASSVTAEVFSNWLREGLRDDPPKLPALTALEVLPGSRVLNYPARWQQLAVRSTFADGRVTDVTRLTAFSSSDPAIAEVSASGLVEFQQSGEVAILCRYLDQMRSVRLTYLQTPKDFHWKAIAGNNYVDQHIFDKLKLLSLAPSDLCTDQEFLRRVSLDICGVLPTPEETLAFLKSNAPDKRALLIDRLLERSEYADFWTLKWLDVLRSNRRTIQIKGIHVYQDWLHEQIERNAPFDQIVRSLVTAKGNTSANPPANFYRIARDPQNLAETTAQLFFGIRMQCAKCHNHPFERWTQDDYYSLAAFFARVRQKPDPSEGGTGAEYIYADRSGEVVQPRTGHVMAPKTIGAQPAKAAPGGDRLELLADWLTASPYFSRSLANRVWFHLMGRGIVEPVDDFRDSNPSANDELLEALSKDLVAHHFDVKHLIRVIANSRTYQLSAQTNNSNKDDIKYFSHAVTRLLTAEQLLDAICSATGVGEKYPGMPPGTRAAQLPDGEVNNIFLKTFGQPARELACECEREGDSNLAQALQLINGPTINDKVRSPENRLGKLLSAKAPASEILTSLYLAALSRKPDADEVKTALAHLQRGVDKRKAWEDVQWALVNSKEFLFRH